MRLAFFMQLIAVLSLLSSCANNSSLVSYQDSKIDDLNKEIVELTTENKLLKAQIKDLKNQVNDLANELKDVDAC